MLLSLKLPNFKDNQEAVIENKYKMFTFAVDFQKMCFDGTKQKLSNLGNNTP